MTASSNNAMNDRDLRWSESLRSVHGVAGAGLIVAGLLPNATVEGRIVEISAILGVAPFAVLFQTLYPLLAGSLLLALNWRGFTPRLRGAAGIFLFLVFPAVFHLYPLNALEPLGMWSHAPGHQVLLLLGLWSVATASRLRVGKRDGTLFSVVGSALLVAYLLAPTPTGIPVLELFRVVSPSTVDSGLQWVLEGLRVAAHLVPPALAIAILLVTRSPPGSAEQQRRGAMLVGWLAMGLLPALLLPRVVMVGHISEDPTLLLGLLRHLLVLTALLFVPPHAIFAVISRKSETGGRPRGPSLE